MFKSFKEQKELKKKAEGKVVELPDEKEVLEVSTEPVDTKIEKDDKNTFEEFKVLYKGQIDDKCLEDYGTIEDKKLWEDTAKELFMASEDYIPDEDDKAEKIEESKEIKEEDHQLYYDDIQEMSTSERHLLWKQYHEEDFEDSEEGNNKFWDWAEEEFPFKEIEEESKSERYQVREFDGSGAKFGVYDTKEKKFVQKGSKYIMDAACKDLNEKGKVTESSIIKYTLKEMMNKKQESIEDGASIFELKFDCSNEDTFGIGEEMINPIANTLREVIEKIEIGRFDGPIMDVNGNKIGSFGIGYQGVESGLSESKKVEEGIRDELIQLRKDNRGLYDYVANNYLRMSTEELKEIALDAIYVANNDFKIINEYAERMDESVNADIEKAKKDSIKKGLYTESEDVPNITWILENYDWDVDIMTEEQLGSDYLYRELCRNVDEAARFNYHSDYWGDADSYQDANIELMEQIEPYVGKEVIVDFDDGSQKYKILGIAIDKQYNSLSHTCILAEEFPVKELNESKLQEDQYESERRRGVPPIKRIAEQEVYDNEEWYRNHINDYLDITDFVNKNIKEIASEYNLKETKAEEACKEIYKIAIELNSKKEEAVEEEVNVTDADEDINSVMVVYISNQTFRKYYNLEKPLTIDELKNIRLKIKNHEMYITDIADKVRAVEVNSKKELIPNTYIMKIKENDEESLEESKKIQESQVSDYTFKELNKVINDKGNDFKIQISGSEDKTNWLNIDKEDLQAIYQALQNKKAK